jgi:hypothetical protein
MRAIDTNDNFGGGKVKFFSGGTGGGQEIFLTPLVFGTNEITVGSEGMIPLNGAGYAFPYGGPTSAIGSDRAVSNLPSIEFNYFYWKSLLTFRRNTSVDCEYAFDLIINGEIIATETVVLNTDNGYVLTFDPIVESFNEFPTSTFGIYARQTDGNPNGLTLSSNHFFLSEIDSQNDYSEWFSSSNFLNGISELTAGQTYSSAFGGGAIGIVSSEYPYPIFSQFPIQIEVHGLYICFCKNATTTVGYANEIVVSLVGVGGLIENVPIPEGTYNYYEIIYLELSTPYLVTQGLPIGIKVSIDGGSSGQFPIYELGAYGYNTNQV